MGVELPISIALSVCQQARDQGRVLGIVYRVIATHLIKSSGHTRTTALPDNVCSLIFLTFLGEVANLEFPAILGSEVNPEA